MGDTLADVLLVSCVKTKRSQPSMAKHLYTSTLFQKQRTYAEGLGVPWFILSADHGLVAPEEWIAPYERYLSDTPAAYHAAWAGWVAARLELLAGPVLGAVVEIHAGAQYVDLLRPLLVAAGAEVVEPLKGLAMGPRLAWYGNQPKLSEPVDLAPHAEDGAIIEQLLDVASAKSPDDFLKTGAAWASPPGLYSWWVDDTGAGDLSRGLGLPVNPGLIYAGLAGATRWPSGKQSNNTLWLRITTMHLAGNHEFSTFRRTLGAILAKASGSSRVDEAALSGWMHDHLKVVAVAFDDRDELGRLEARVLKRLDPPLNLQGMRATIVRQRLKELRRIVTSERS